jgi:predicted nucleic acid-binding protein
VILPDTSIWVDHLRQSRATPLLPLLGQEAIVVHPFVIGELALGHLGPRESILEELHRLPQAVVASHDEVLALIEGRHLFGFGIGLVDVHLLASTRLMFGSSLWTNDKRLRAVAESLGLAYSPTP